MTYYFYDTVTGVFEKRVNRFVAQVRIMDYHETVHVPNTGRMAELLTYGRKVLCRYVDNPLRKTRYDLLAVEVEDTWMYIDSRLPNILVRNYIEDKMLDEFSEYIQIKSEVTFGVSRFDLGLVLPNQKWLIENKCCTLVEDGVGKFPDAPTKRGARHVQELKKAKDYGFRCAVFFVIQCNYAKYFRPNDEIDPIFGQAIREAASSGVKIYAFNCQVGKNSIALGSALPTIL